MRVIIKVGRSCNNDCSFCHSPDRRRGFEPASLIDQKVQRASSLGARMIIFSGGEPTLHPHLLTLAHGVHSRGMDLGLITNGRRLADPKLVEALIHQGLRYAYVSLHGATATTHDVIVRSKAFHETLEGIRNLTGRIDFLTVNTVLTRQNLSELRGLLDLLDGFQPLCRKFTFPQPKGAACSDFERIVPSLTEASKAVVDAISHASRDRLPKPSDFGLEGFPACLVSGLHHLRNDLQTNGISHISEPEDDDLMPVDTLLFTMTSRCEGCSLRRHCPGILRGYLERWGDNELAPLRYPSDVLDHDRINQQAREQAAHEKRHWVRITHACNNRCRFCLDRDSGHSSIRSDEAIKKDIVQGRKQGARRLILSGGEPTTHPRFAALIRLGKRAGYPWVQAVSNGRMLSYPRFLAEVIAAGLDEVTVSMHGHTPRLHDGLVGVKGAFEQAAQGIRAAIATRRLVVNIDIVINAHNVDVLSEMIETFSSWGVREFDLLQLIPFGAAWLPEQRDLFYDLDQHAHSIHRALDLSKKLGLQVWLNRFPPEHAEGYEFLIQDPHKLHDEVRGRLEAFEGFVHGGPHLPCREPARCQRCYLQPLCDEFEAVRKLALAPHVPMLRTRAGIDMPLPSTDLLEVMAPTAMQAEALVSRLRAKALRLRLENLHDLSRAIGKQARLADIPVKEVLVSQPENLPYAMACESVDIVVELNRSMVPLLPSLGAQAHRLVIEQPTYDRLTDASQFDIDLTQWVLGYSVRMRGIAPCLGGGEPQRPQPLLDAGILRSDGSLDPQLLTAYFVKDRFFSKSLRCKRCHWNEDCLGMHLNWLRAHGFAALNPIFDPAGSSRS